jgi:hypothetical protein
LRCLRRGAAQAAPAASEQSVPNCSPTCAHESPAARASATKRSISTSPSCSSCALISIAVDDARRSSAPDTPIGMLPAPGGLNVDGLSIDAGDVDALLRVDPEEWLQEIGPMRDFYPSLRDSLLAELRRRSPGSSSGYSLRDSQTRSTSSPGSRASFSSRVMSVRPWVSAVAAMRRSAVPRRTSRPAVRAAVARRP